MSRKRKKHHANNQKKSKRYIVPLDDWNKYEQYKDIFGQIEGLTNKLDHEWNKSKYHHNPINNLIRSLVSIVKRYSYKSSLSGKPPEVMMMAEILIEEILDEKLCN